MIWARWGSVPAGPMESMSKDRWLAIQQTLDQRVNEVFAPDQICPSIRRPTTSGTLGSNTRKPTGSTSAAKLSAALTLAASAVLTPFVPPPTLLLTPPQTTSRL